MADRVALVVGGTGLVGTALITELVAQSAFDSAFDKVISFGRRPPLVEAPALSHRPTDFTDVRCDIEEALAEAGCRPSPSLFAFCALGTTIKKAGSQPAFSLVDHDYVVAFATAARAAGADWFGLVSAAGADARSAVFYSQVKGRTEQDVRAVGFNRLDLFRPGLLIGKRAEPRLAEEIGIVLSPALNALMIGPLAAYRSIDADKVARAMIAAADQTDKGTFIHSPADMVALASSADR